MVPQFPLVGCGMLSNMMLLAGRARPRDDLGELTLFLHQHPGIVGQHRIVVEHVAQHCHSPGHLHHFLLLPIRRIFDDIIDRQALDSSGTVAYVVYPSCSCVCGSTTSQAQKLQPHLHHLGGHWS